MTSSRRRPVDRYTCEDVIRRLDDYLDHELSAVEMRMVREHLGTCAACASEHAFEAQMLDEIRVKLQHIVAPPALVNRISTMIDANRSDPGDT